MSILRKDIAIIEWANEIQSEIKQIERLEIKLDEPSDEIPF
jgi:tRNA A37 threonylcarbamoyladenosine biosynthesis protein TsaE